jgi:hypothetical protein
MNQLFTLCEQGIVFLSKEKIFKFFLKIKTLTSICNNCERHDKSTISKFNQHVHLSNVRCCIYISKIQHYDVDLMYIHLLMKHNFLFKFCINEFKIDIMKIIIILK